MVKHCFKILGIDYKSSNIHCDYCSTYCFVYDGNKLEFLGDFKPDDI